MKCYVCKKNEGIKNENYGWLPCQSCQNKQGRLRKAARQSEMVGENIKAQRKQYLSDILPAHRKGVLDKGFVEKYGAKKAKEQGFTNEEIKKAKYVWGSESYYKP